MENENLSGMHGLELTRHSAQAIVNDIGGIVHQNINMMDKNGVIIASCLLYTSRQKSRCK